VQPAERAERVYRKTMSYDSPGANPLVLLCRKCTLFLIASAPADQPSAASRKRGREFGWYGVHLRTSRTCNQRATGADYGLHPPRMGDRIG
jgi:hypothetical protein